MQSNLAQSAAAAAYEVAELGVRFHIGIWLQDLAKVQNASREETRVALLVIRS